MTANVRAVLVETLIYHQRRDIEGCCCGWAVLGASHAEHVADVFFDSMRVRMVGVEG